MFHTKNHMKKKSMFWAIFIWLKPQDLRQLTVRLQGFNKKNRTFFILKKQIVGTVNLSEI